MIAKRLLRLKMTVLVFLMTLAVSAQLTTTLSCRRYTTQDGLPQMQTETLFQDTRGYIYVGTLSGFVRYDGQEFTPFLTGHRWNIVGFMETSEGVSALSFRQQWLIDDEKVNLSPLDPQGHWLLNNFNSPDLPNGYVLFEDEQEQHRWIGKATDGNGFTRIYDNEKLDLMMPDRKLFLDGSTLYIPTGEGLYRDKQQISSHPDFYTLFRKGDTLYAFAQSGIYSVEGDSVRLLTPFDKWSTGYGLIVRQAKDGTLLIADEHSLYSYAPPSPQPFGQPSSGREAAVTKLASGFNLIKALFIDRWDRLWLATYQGLYCFFNRHFVNYTLSDSDDIVRGIGVVATDEHGFTQNIRGNPCSSVAHNAVANPVLGTLNGKIIIGERVVYDNPDDFFQPSAAVIDSCVYLAGRNDVACVRDSMVRWLGLPFDRYQFVTEANGLLIIGTRQVIAAYNPRTGITDTLSAEIPHPWCAAADNEGRLWVGSTFGLSLIENQETVSPIPFPQKLIITTMESDSQGAVFFASCDSLFLIRNGEVHELSSQIPQLSGHEVRSLHVSPKGFLVVAAIDGLFVCRVTDDYRLTDICFFNHLNGFTIVEPQKARMAESTDGIVWLCGLEQVTSFRPSELVADAQADTFISPPMRWWQHWWVWLIGLLLLTAVIWLTVRWIEERRSRRKLLRIQRQKQEREQLIRAIREEAMKANDTLLAKDIVKMTAATPEPKRLTLRSQTGSLVVDADDIVFLKADGNYTQLHTFYSTDLVMTGIGAIAKQLDAPYFVRADRSTLVNICFISRLDTVNRSCIFRSHDGKELKTNLMLPAFKRLAGIL